MQMCRWWLSNSVNAFLPTHNSCMSFCAHVNVLRQFAKVILYTSETSGNMGTLFAINTKVRGNVFHCLFLLYCGHFFIAWPAQTYAFPRGMLGPGTGSPGPVVMAPSCWSSRNIWTVLSDIGFDFRVVLRGARSWTQWRLWDSSTSGYSVILWSNFKCASQFPWWERRCW